jgi:hypothetical protein
MTVFFFFGSAKGKRSANNLLRKLYVPPDFALLQRYEFGMMPLKRKMPFMHRFLLLFLLAAVFMLRPRICGRAGYSHKKICVHAANFADTYNAGV